MQFFRIPPTRVALPELLASKLLQWWSTPTAVFAQLFGNKELPTSRCRHSIMLEGIPPCNVQKWCPSIPKGSRRGWLQRGQSTCACNFCVTKVIWLSIGGRCPLNTSKGSFRPVAHSWVPGVGHAPSAKQ